MQIFIHYISHCFQLIINDQLIIKDATAFYLSFKRDQQALGQIY